MSKFISLPYSSDKDPDPDVQADLLWEKHTERWNFTDISTWKIVYNEIKRQLSDNTEQQSSSKETCGEKCGKKRKYSEGIEKVGKTKTAHYEGKPAKRAKTTPMPGSAHIDYWRQWVEAATVLRAQFGTLDAAAAKGKKDWEKFSEAIKKLSKAGRNL